MATDQSFKTGKHLQSPKAKRLVSKFRPYVTKRLSQKSLAI